MSQKWVNGDSEIILALIKERSHLRALARKLNSPLSTIQRRIAELQKENVIDYRMEGKNKVFFLKNNLQAKNYIYSAERYKLAKLLKRYPQLSVIFDDLLRSINSRMIVLFGSYAKFSAKPDSDIDIYIDTPDVKAKRKAEGINSKIRAKTGKFDTGSLLIKEIIRNHVILRGIEEFYEKSRFFEQT
jgi:predicted nucleotidyltransferase